MKPAAGQALGSWLLIAACLALFGGAAILAGPGYFLVALLSSIVLTAGFHWWTYEARELDPAAPLAERLGMILVAWFITFMLSLIGLGVLLLIVGH